jgi:Tfp pilus assembly protein PilF
MDEAITEFKSLLQINPNDMESHHNLALAYEKKGDLRKAQEETELYRRSANRQAYLTKVPF